MIITNRRGFLGGLLAVVAAPAIVRFDHIMPVKLLEVPKPGLILPGPGRALLVNWRGDNMHALLEDGSLLDVTAARGRGLDIIFEPVMQTLRWDYGADA